MDFIYDLYGEAKQPKSKPSESSARNADRLDGDVAFEIGQLA